MRLGVRNQQPVAFYFTFLAGSGNPQKESSSQAPNSSSERANGLFVFGI